MTTKQNEIMVADLFCGAGGSSTGAQRAIEGAGGRMNLVAVNHWNTAIATHSANHPDALHVIEDVSIADPEALVPNGYLDLLMASPQCTYHSRARGGKPIHDQGRMNPWAVHNWITKLNIRAVLIENVPEFTAWGPLDETGRPIKAKRGEHFGAWYMAFLNLGYQAEWRMINSADYGDATSRTRFFLIARNDGKPIRWPEPTHAKATSPLFPERQQWRGAREIIDWTNTGRSILDDPKYQRKPLSDNTKRRIARGLEKYGGPLAPLFIELLKLPEYEGCAATINDDGQPFVLNRHGENGGLRVHALDAPVPTITTSGAGYLIRPILVEYYKQSDARPIDLPLSTITAKGRKHGLTEPILVEYYGSSTAASIDRPLPTVTTKDRHALVSPTIVQVNNLNKNEKDNGDNRRTHSVDEPLPTLGIATGIAAPFVIQANHGNGPQGDAGNDRRVHEITEPLPSLTTVNGLAMAQGVAQPYITPNFGERPGQEPRTHSIDEPLPAITGRGAGNLVTPELTKAEIKKAKAGRLIRIDGTLYELDIRFRMLQNPELARAMGFTNEETEYQFTGNNSQITKQIGNAVPVKTASALVKAILE